jgi:apolipoprotein N-acyltransferase
MNSCTDKFFLSIFQQWVLTLTSFFLVAFGQPAWLPLNGFIAGAIGYALFGRVLLVYSSSKQRFFLGMIWFGAVQLVQLSWFLSHPFWYIYAVYFFLAALLGFQFGILSIFIHIQHLSQTKFRNTLWSILSISALWTIFEWSRLFILSGFSWNPVGIALTNNLYALQTASIGGVYALSFWVIFVNFVGLWAWFQKRFFGAMIWLILAALPYAFGVIHLAYHKQDAELASRKLTTMLIQTAFAPEEIDHYSNKKGIINHVIDEWRIILAAAKKHQGQNINLIVLPEFVVPFGTYSDIYPLINVYKAFFEILGPDSLKALPSLGHPFFSLQNTISGPQILINNAFWTQAIANYFQADILIGLEDAEDSPKGRREYYSSAIFIHPNKLAKQTAQVFFAERYAKRILVPMGEYIPFKFCKKLAESYGVFGSFTCGKEAMILTSNGIPFSPSICYEETYGNIVREGKQKGAQLLVNLTSDAWFPDSRLPKQHFDHSRLRTVENGVPLIRACNTGITAAVDSFGRDIAVLGGKDPKTVEWVSDSLLVNVPIYSYDTFYARFGDLFIIGLSAFILLGCGLSKIKGTKKLS